jgi:hypothetical protein
MGMARSGADGSGVKTLPREQLLAILKIAGVIGTKAAWPDATRGQ